MLRRVEVKLKKNIKKILALLLCVLILGSLTACRLPKIGRRQDKPDTPVSNPLPIEIQLPGGSDTEPLDLEYYHYDASDFYKDLDKLTEEDYSLYSSLYNELLTMDELSSIAYIRYTENVNDTYYSDEYDYMNDLFLEAADAFLTKCHDIISGGHGEEFRKFLNNDEMADLYLEYEPMTEEQRELNTKENDLIQQYYSQADTLMDTSCTIDGKTYTLEDVIGDGGDLFYLLHPDLYLEIYNQCLKNYNELVGETFVELVQVRDQIAKASGYENYAEYADKEIYDRDYTEEDLAAFKKTVKHFADDLQYYSYSFSDSANNRDTDPEQLLRDCNSILSGISPLAKEAFGYFYQNRLYSIGEEENRLDGAYTIYLSNNKTAYSCIKEVGTVEDTITLAHEFGHFAAFYFSKPDDPILSSSCLDVQEIHSQGLQLLFSEKADSLFGSNPNNTKAANVAHMASAILDGCILDDWQREVYKNPDMTLSEMNACFERIEKEYGSDDYPGLEYLWTDIRHNFDSPMYYISYAISAIGALEIWHVSQSDYDRAVRIWENLVNSDIYHDDYTTIVENAGLKSFADKEATYDTLDDMTTFLADALYGSSTEY